MKTHKLLFILIITIICSTASFSLANQIETNKLMRYAAELSKSGKNKEALKISGKVMIGENVKIGKNVKIVGPVLIGNDCSIEGDAHIGPNVSIGSKTLLNDCKIKDSIIMENCKISIDINLENSIIPYNTIISSNKEKKSIILCEDSKLEL